MKVVKSKRKQNRRRKKHIQAAAVVAATQAYTPFRYTRLHKIIWNYAHLFLHLFLFTARYNHNDLLIYIFAVVWLVSVACSAVPLTIPIIRLYFPFRAVPCRILWSNSVSISHRSLKSSSLGEFRFLVRRFIDVYINHHPKQFFLFSFLFWIWFYFICTDYACLSASSLFACDLNRSDSVDGFLFSLEFLVSSAIFVYRPF